MVVAHVRCGENPSHRTQATKIQMINRLLNYKRTKAKLFLHYIALLASLIAWNEYTTPPTEHEAT